MKQCIINKCESTHLVYSGVDAFLLGIPTEKVCYEHAKFYAEAASRDELALVTK